MGTSIPEEYRTSRGTNTFSTITLVAIPIIAESQAKTQLWDANANGRWLETCLGLTCSHCR